MRTAKKAISVADLAWELDEEETSERPARAPLARSAYTTRRTRRMEKIDARLIAIARGELDPDAAHDPPPRRERASARAIDVLELIEVDEDWLSSDVEPEPFE
ncbi:MAG: hypothetical protein KIS78_07045 [Labilithrix sp.]|nr:hypothetical protein [Labilithrix sp.]MCW5832189.1 hypothetical protein [Labilithrix sp.]